MIFTAIPIRAVDMIGSIGMIVLSVMCLRMARLLRRKDPQNIIWIYLFWVCTAMTLFAVSRSAGHIVKQILILSGHNTAWNVIQPFSGAVNTFTFVVVGAITLFFQRSWHTYRLILKDKLDLQTVRDELIYVNQNLEKLVADRTHELVISEKKYRRIFEVSRDMVVVTLSNGEIVDINPAGCDMIGIVSKSALEPGYRFQACFSDQTDWQRVMEKINANGFITNTEVKLKRNPNRTIRVLLSGAVDHSEADRSSTIHFLVKDIEEQRRIEEQIAQADKLASIGQLSAGIAHEINNPLGIILGYTQLLIRHEDGSSETYQDLKTIEKHVRSCKTIVEDLLNFARTSKPREDEIRIETVIDDVINFVQQHAGLKKIAVERSYDPTLPKMLLDEKKIKQVLMNLIMNAKHAMGDQGRLGVSTRYDADHSQAVIQVTDSGHGIQTENLGRIFDPFFTTKPTGEGTGLGLSVSYGIIKNHGGDISVTSEPGSGAAFTVRLPVVSPSRGHANAKDHSDRR